GMKVTQIRCGRHRRLLRVEALVDPSVDAKPVQACRRGHELPEALSSDAGHRARVEPALDHGRGGKFGWKPPGSKDGEDHPEVVRRSLEPEADDVSTAGRESVDEELHVLLIDGRIVNDYRRAALEPR